MSQNNKAAPMASQSREEMIDGFRKGDPGVIQILYDSHFVALCDYCYFIVGNTCDAQDVVSEVFEKLLGADRKKKEIGQSFLDMNDVVNYLYVAAKNRCINLIGQKKRKHALHQQATDRTYQLDEELDFEYHKNLGDLKLLEKVYSLSHRCIRVLQKLYFEDMSYEEIAAEMNISLGTVSSLRRRGIDVLAKHLNKDDFHYIGVLLIFLLSIF
jgi:RNA polymerase sigma factor (sigma-70 family)